MHLNLPAVAGKSKMIAMIMAMFGAGLSIHSICHGRTTHPDKPAVSLKGAALLWNPHSAAAAAKKTLEAVQRLSGPYAEMVMIEAQKAHVAPRIVAAVVQVENGGDFNGSSHRVSSAGAIGVMQLEPATAWDTLHVNPWIARQNIRGGAQYLAMMLHEFGGNLRLALMAYNAGPNFIAQGGRPQDAIAYAQEVIRYARI